MSTFCSLNYHITFSTKLRKPWIKEEWIERLHAYLGGIVKQGGAVPLRIGGVEDHVHLLVALKTTHRISDFMRDLKKNSSKWVHETICFAPFEWQDGYAAFTVSPSACASVTNYIANQKKHHRKRSFREELEELLNLAGIQYDPQYLE